jgi:hypothetical protein
MPNRLINLVQTEVIGPGGFNSAMSTGMNQNLSRISQGLLCSLVGAALAAAHPPIARAVD